MSECITRVTKIGSIEPHTNADALEIAHVDGWHCVVPKDVYKKGDLCVYIPIDSVLPQALEMELFGNAKVSLSKGRIKTIRLRGLYSQGLVANIDTIKVYLGNHGKHQKLEEGTDITEALEIKKYEPPLPGFQQFNNKSRIRYQNPEFKKYTSIENIKNYPNIFNPDDDVILTEKIHGTNFRAGWVTKDTSKMSFIQKLVYSFLLIFNKNHKWEFTVGSHNVQLNAELTDNTYTQIAEKYKLKEKLGKGEILYGEIYGPNIQKGYHYGLNNEEKNLIIFDIRKDGIFQDWSYLEEFSIYEGIDLVPILYKGKFSGLNLEEILTGNSVFAPSQKIIEGGVLRTLEEDKSNFLKSGRKILKCINPEYLLKGAKSEFH